MEDNQQNELTKKERKELRRQERIEEKQKLARQRATKRITKIALDLAIVVGSIGVFAWYIASRPPIPEGEIISRKGLHFHLDLAVLIKGEKQEIPANLGIGAAHNPIHTHDASGVIHLEFSGLVKEDDIRLGRFFKNWGKQFNKDCIFDKCSGPEGKLKLFVNDKENSDFENYVMRDKDKIEIVFE